VLLHCTSRREVYLSSSASSRIDPARSNPSQHRHSLLGSPPIKPVSRKQAAQSAPVSHTGFHHIFPFFFAAGGRPWTARRRAGTSARRRRTTGVSGDPKKGGRGGKVTLGGRRRLHRRGPPPRRQERRPRRPATTTSSTSLVARFSPVSVVD
jgi:hypothetical protein